MRNLKYLTPLINPLNFTINIFMKNNYLQSQNISEKCDIIFIVSQISVMSGLTDDNKFLSTYACNLL